MAVFHGFDSALGEVTWQDLLGLLLQDSLSRFGYRVFIDGLYAPATNQLSQPRFGSHQISMNDMAQPLLHLQNPLGIRPMKVIFIEREGHMLLTQLPDGMDIFGNFNLLLFSRFVIEAGDLERLNDYLGDYSKLRGFASNGNFSALAVGPRIGAQVFQYGFEELMPGVFTHPERPWFCVLNTRQVATIPENELWNLFSFDPPKVRRALLTYRVNHPSYKVVLDAINARLQNEKVI